jgi:hypothetical protein
VAESNTLIEKNTVRHMLATMNDGGGIAIDHADGLVIQDNIVSDPIGSFQNGAATNAPHNVAMGIGIYFGNTSVKNTIVRRNTVMNCVETGIHVDHTMVTTGLQVKDNVLFNNGVQLTVSDYSNGTGEGATPPYYVPNYNDVYSGNVMYCLSKDQLCMVQYNCHSGTPVDFGTYSGNRYYNPYNEMSIEVINFVAGAPRFYALERWQTEKGEDAGSTRSPLRLNAFSTLQELSGNLVQNGDFASNVSGWTGWPDNAQVTRVTDHLDNGALKAYLPDNSQYPNFTLHNPDLFPLQNNAWYRVRCSVQSGAQGDVTVGVKGQSQFQVPDVIWQRQVPFDGERRDLEMYFQSTLGDQAQVQFTNQWTEPMYYLDNVQVNKVTVQPIDPAERNRIFVNDQSSPQTFDLPQGCWKGMDDAFLNGSITVQPYSSAIAYKVEGTDCGGSGTPSGSIRMKVYLGGALDDGVSSMRADLRAAGLVPTTEPYTALGYVLENAGVTVDPAVMQVTGAHAVVDWVVLELRHDNATNTVAGRRAALVCRDGTVITPDGSDLLTFNGTAQGKVVSVRHRNHLGALCTTILDGNGQLVDLTLPSTPTYGTDAQKNINGRMALWPGNVDIDTMVKYTGVANDRDEILSTTGGAVSTNIVSGYLDGDVNLNGIVSYTGAHNDRDAVLTTIGGAVVTASRVEQLP